MTGLVGLVFVLTYLGMAAGRVPGLAIERSGMAVAAAMLLVVAGAISPSAAMASIDGTTLAVLLGLMVLSAQFGAAGFYDWAAARVAGAEGDPRRLLFLTIMVAGGLSAMLANDVVVFAMTPVLCLGARARGLDPRPFLAGLAGAANAGSAATLIGNPQNILIGATGGLDFWRFLSVCGPPAFASLIIVHLVVAWVWRAELAGAAETPRASLPALDRSSVRKGVIAAFLFVAALTIGADRAVSALAVAAFLLVSRKHAPRKLMAEVDWPLILLFAGLFVVNGAFAETGLARRAFDALDVLPSDLGQLRVLAPFAFVASNTIGNVPAVILLLVQAPALPARALEALALLSTLAGNLLLVGSLANLIVAERAAAVGTRFGFRDHARAGVPMTLASFALALAWLVAGDALGLF
jgi:Na+/H+ antiporter NhaD/arsenite permease-like protein